MAKAHKSGARHSGNDRELIKGIHGKAKEIEQAAVDLGAELEEMAEEAGEATEGNALKAISVTDDELRVANYIVLFGGRDLTAFGMVGNTTPVFKNADGSAGEFFTKNTDFESDYTAIGRLPEDWEHGLAEKLDGLGRDDILGYADWETKRVDARGVWVERVLNRRNQYVKWLEELVKAGLVGTSSEAVEGKAEKKSTGEITRWPLRRDTLTVQPAEPRMMDENVVAALKALGINSGQPGQAAPDGATAHPVSANRSERQPNMAEPTQTQTPEAPAWDKKSFDDLTGALTKLTGKVGELEAKLNGPVLPITGSVITTVPDDAKPFKSLGEQVAAVIKATYSPHDADARIHKYNLKRLADLKATGMHEGGLAEGGAFVQTEFSNQLMERTYETGRVLARVPSQPIGANANAYSALLIKETSRAAGSRYGGLRVYRLGEGGTITASRPEFDRKEIRPYKLAALCYLTDELVQDATALEGHVRRLFPLEASFLMEDELFSGTGAGQSMGVLNATATVSIAKETGQAATSIVYNNLVKMWARLWPGSEGQAIWYANKDIFPQLMTLFLAAGTAGIPPNGVVFANGSFTIFGRPVVFVEYCPTLGTVGDIMLVDFGQYLGVSKGEMRTDSSIHVQFTTDEVALRFIWRYAAEPLWRSALTPRQGTNTMSPYVTLATRA